jgi:hypothetical protein
MKGSEQDDARTMCGGYCVSHQAPILNKHISSVVSMAIESGLDYIELREL